MSLKKILTYSILTLTAVGGFFGHIDANINPTELANISIGIDSTYAADPAPTSTEKPKEQTSKSMVEMYNSLIDGINIAFAVLSVLVTPVILFVGWLMSPDWTSGDIFGLRAPMYQLWITVSNIVYFIYAVLLIMIALGTMFGDDKFSYKVMLPKLALGILMVPFTWWFVQWTVSIANVVTASVMTIPQDTIGIGNSAWFETERSIPNKITVDNTGNDLKETKKITCPSADCITPKEFLQTSGGIFGPLVVYGYSIFKFDKITKIDNLVDVAGAALQIVHSSIVSLLMFIVFGILVMALAVLLIVRAVKLWMYAIFAPLFTFRFVAGSNMLGGDDDSFSIKEFIGLAFVPAIIGLTLSFGLIMINAITSTHADTQNKSTKSTETCKTLQTTGCTIGYVMGDAKNIIVRKVIPQEGDTSDPVKKITETTFKFGGVDFVFRGKAVNPTGTPTETTGALSAVGGIFATLIVDIIALVFIWVAFMAAKNVSKAVSAAVQPFEEMGKTVGNMAKKMPTYMPLPIPGGSIKGLGKAASGISSIAEYNSDKRFKDSKIGQWISEKQGGTAASAEDIANMRNAINKTGGESVEEMRNIADTIRTTGRGASLYGQEQRPNLEALAEKVAKNPDNMKNFLKQTYGLQQGEHLFSYLKDGKINDDNEAKIVAAMLSQRKNGEIITTPQRAEEVLKSTASNNTSTSSNNANAPQAINLNINTTQGAGTIASEITQQLDKNRPTRQELESILTDKFKDASGNPLAKSKEKIGEIINAIPESFFKP